VAPVTDDQVERVRALVAAIPAGRVATYGDIAAAAELSSPRIVGWIMRTDSSDLPWHRVITASGRPARHLATQQLERLRAEGVLAVDGRVSLSEIRYELRGAPAADAGRGGNARRKRAPTRRQERLGQPR
jgi:methylated-DNA-protein-cysteine methyltransferase-like protein